MAERRADPRLQFGHAERLGHVVVGASVQSSHLAVLQRGGREHDDGHLAPAADAVDDVQPVEVGQPEVEHNYVR